MLVNHKQDAFLRFSTPGKIISKMAAVTLFIPTRRFQFRFCFEQKFVKSDKISDSFTFYSMGHLNRNKATPNAGT